MSGNVARDDVNTVCPRIIGHGGTGPGVNKFVVGMPPINYGARRPIGESYPASKSVGAGGVQTVSLAVEEFVNHCDDWGRTIFVPWVFWPEP